MKRETTIIILSMLTLTLAGALMVFSIGAIRSPNAILFLKHLVFLLAGLIGFLVMMRFDYHYLGTQPALRYIVLGALALLGLTFMPGIGLSMGGASRWIGWRSLSFQPSEFAKFALVLLLAVRMTQHQERIKQFFAGFVMPFGIAGVFAGIVLAQKDIGIPFIMFGATLSMVWAAGARKRYIIGSGLIGGVLATPLIALQSYRLERIIAFLDPWTYRQETGWQLIQSMSAFAQGGFWGRGAGAGEQKLGYLPAAHTDFVFAMIGEELGFVGALITVLLFVAILYASLRIAANAPELFGTLLAVGIVTLVAFQALFIISVTLGLMPTKGLPLPFVSYGGTSTLVNLTMMGVLVNIGAQSVARAPKRRRQAAKQRRKSAPLPVEIAAASKTAPTVGAAN